jgi:hypothetical protein
MTKIHIHIHQAGDKLIAVSDGKNGQVLTIPPDREEEIRKLMAERHRIGLELTAQLKSLGLRITEDDETVVWNSVG